MPRVMMREAHRSKLSLIRQKINSKSKELTKRPISGNSIVVERKTKSPTAKLIPPMNATQTKSTAKNKSVPIVQMIMDRKTRDRVIGLTIRIRTTSRQWRRRERARVDVVKLNKHFRWTCQSSATCLDSHDSDYEKPPRLAAVIE